MSWKVLSKFKFDDTRCFFLCKSKQWDFRPNKFMNKIKII